MRFNISEYNDIQEIIAKAKLDQKDFSNVKKRGRLNIRYKNGEAFVFFRRASMVLDKEKQWQRQKQYEIGPAKKLIAEGVDWDTVKKHFRNWINSLKATEN